MSLRYAIIGCGRISHNHIAVALDNKLQITALCDIVESKMDDKIEKFNLPKDTKKYVDYKEMLKAENLSWWLFVLKVGNMVKLLWIVLKLEPI